MWVLFLNVCLCPFVPGVEWDPGGSQDRWSKLQRLTSTPCRQSSSVEFIEIKGIGREERTGERETEIFWTPSPVVTYHGTPTDQFWVPQRREKPYPSHSLRCPKVQFWGIASACLKPTKCLSPPHSSGLTQYRHSASEGGLMSPA